MQFRVLGPMEARTNEGRPAQLGAQKHRTLLAVLLLSANHSVAVESIARAIWPQRPPRSAAAVLRTYVSALRKALQISGSGASTRLETCDRGYRLRVAPGDLDALVFAELTSRGQRELAAGRAEVAAATLHCASTLWRGRLLENVPMDSEHGPELCCLEELRLDTLESLAEARLALGRDQEVLAELAPLVASQPHRERLHAHWMLALYRCGQQAEALDVFQRLRVRLIEQLGIEPSPPLQRLHRQILAGDPQLDPPVVPAFTTSRPAVVPHQLPPDIASFTGRRAEVAWLRRMLTGHGDARTVVVSAIDGIGGIGKSALAVHVAHLVADRFPDGQLYVNLDGSSATVRPAEPLTVLNRFLRALGAQGADTTCLDEAAAAFRALTAGRCMLILLDNARDAAQVQPLLPGGGNCRVVVTSRQVLATVDNAVHLHVDLLAPTESVALLDRLAGPGRVGADAEAANEIARLCGYLPLALRIAGARLAARPSWSTRTLADRLADAERRLDQLQLGDLGVRTCFDVSLQLLGEGEDPGDRTAAAAFALLTLLDGTDLSTAVVSALLGWPVPRTAGVLERLVDAQLLESRVPARYRVHNLLRLFGRETAGRLYRPAERVAALTRAVAWYADMAVAALRLVRPGDRHPVLAGPTTQAGRFSDARQALDWLEAEHANVIAAVAQCSAVRHFPASVLTRLAQALSGFFLVRGYWHDWMQVNHAALAVAERAGDPVGRAYAERDLGVCYERLADYPRALAHLYAALATFRQVDERHGTAACLTSLGITLNRQGRYADSVECGLEALAMRRADGDLSGQAASLNNLGMAYQRLGDYARAQECFDESAAIAARVGDRRAQAAILTNLGVVYDRQGRYADAVACHERSLAVCHDLEDRDGQAICLNNLGRARRRLGDLELAAACQEQGLALARQLGAGLTEAECLRELGTTQDALGRHAQAMATWQRARSIFEQLGSPEAAEVQALLEQDTPA